MNEIMPKGIRRGRGYKTIAWQRVIETYERYPAWGAPMLSLIKSLAASSASSELFPHTSMSTLVIGDTEEFFANDNLLYIHFDTSQKHFEFEHRTLSGMNDKKICYETDAMETLRLFLKYKFGVLFDPNKAKPDAR